MPRQRQITTPPPATLDEQLCFAVYAASLAMKRVYRQLLEELGLTYPQYIVLLALWERDGRTVSELGRQLLLDSGTLTPLLKRMEAAGLLRRVRGTEDERQVFVHLCDNGIALRERAGSVQYQAACASKCGARERDGLIDSLNELRASLLRHVEG
ncbi:MAG: MarR family transcriptional regulator [Ectothiorhodospiraceae bacterium]|nr:MarR family transcriptional regulator [Ectothiorhodospiraceae bacterium]MCH8506225.1 MarR family transcriptional regulator [Ectothiorhodospiraceae bacterium]